MSPPEKLLQVISTSEAVCIAEWHRPNILMILYRHLAYALKIQKLIAKI